MKIHFWKQNCLWKQSRLFCMPHDLQRPVSFEVDALSKSCVFSAFNDSLSAARSRVSAVGIATRYGLDGPGIESRWGRDFPHPSRPPLRPTQPPTPWVPGLSRVKATGVCLWPPTPSSALVKERVELYLYSPSGPSWPVLGWILTLPLLLSTAQVL
jgi:hypothetical protein